jgi:hypothetical protein
LIKSLRLPRTPRQNSPLRPQKALAEGEESKLESGAEAAQASGSRREPGRRQRGGPKKAKGDKRVAKAGQQSHRSKSKDRQKAKVDKAAKKATRAALPSKTDRKKSKR